MALKDRNARLEYNRRYYQEHKERIKAQNKAYKENHSEYYKELNSEYRKNHQEELKKYLKEWSKNHPQNRNEYQRQYHQTQEGRASRLAIDYRHLDNKKGRGKSTITAKWIMENIFTRPCIYCGKSDWRELGCDRIDNSKPHTPKNVVCSCWDCNNMRGTKGFFEFALRRIGAKESDGLIISY